MSKRSVLAMLLLCPAVLFAAPVQQPTARPAPAKPAANAPWARADFQSAVCGYASAVPVTFAFPPAFSPRDPKRGPKAGCFWGTTDDLNRALADPRGAHFEQLASGLFWIRIPENMTFDRATGQFSDEKKLIENLIGSGVGAPRVAHRKFAGSHPALVVTGRAPGGAHAYLLYLSHGPDDRVIVVNYRPPTVETPADEVVWKKFLDSIEAAKP